MARAPAVDRRAAAPAARPTGSDEGRRWYALEPDDAAAALGTSLDTGLSAQEAARRLDEVGPNELEAARAVHPWRLLVDQLRNVLIIILLVAVALSAALGHATEAIVITVIVLFAVLLGFVQEYKAERAIEALREMAAPTATVLRDGETVDVPARELVPGDVMLLEAGDRAPADGRAFEAVSLHVEEAALTGESLPIEKQTAALADEELPVGDRRNMVYAGTTITYGHGRALAVATGMSTEFGGIARLLQTVERSRTPLQLSLDRVGMTLARVAVVLVLLVVGLGFVRGQPFVEMLLFGAALAVAVVPEALPAVITISLTLAAQRMVKRNALIRRLPATETLGSVSVICSDKTGTLTKDEMTARKVFVAGEMLEVSGAGYEPVGELSRNGSPAEPFPALIETLRAAALASDAQLVRDEAEDQWRIRGDPTEGALIVAAAKVGLDKRDLDAELPRVDEIPFSSETKRITTLHETPDGVVAYAKGAPEVILETCVRQLTSDGEVALEAGDREALLATAQELAGQALRVLAVARRPGATRETAEEEMTFLGLVGMIDPPRPEAKAAVRTCEEAGIKPVMITGDHPVTAQAIARELGVLTSGRTVTGAELESMDDEELRRDVDAIQVYARVAPADKLRVVTAFQDNGHYVAMTGDGVNDAPALKKADIGVAMGITGTDVTKEAAAMTLTDDNFASIVAAIEEGRRVFANIKKYLMYLLAANLGEIVLLVGVSLLGWPLPLSAVMILYVNLATDGLPALALSVDPPERDLMRRPPRDRGAGIFTRPVITLMVAGGVASALITFGLFSWARSTDMPLAEAMTLTFATLVLVEFFKAYCFRSDRYSVLDQPFANRWLNRAILWELLMLALVINLPFLQDAFGTVSLTVQEWLLVGGLAFLIVPVLEVTKWILRRSGGRGHGARLGRDAAAARP
ncbi:MAG TPA: cation-translocating P-type ATPase [Solirubrobacteraceae bacterium]|nr:cation-translocating P-type ATPase [Solirubrobacteraceae bacterium]